VPDHHLGPAGTLPQGYLTIVMLGYMPSGKWSRPSWAFIMQ
jgi:hypothetical protein